MFEEGSSPFSGHDLVPVGALGLVWLWLRYWIPQLPPRIPSHWDAAGRVNGWTAPGDLFQLPLWAAGGIWLLLFLVGLAIRNQPRASAFQVFRGWLVTGLALMIGYLGPMAAFQGQGAILPALGILAACLLAGAMLAVRAARGGA